MYFLVHWVLLENRRIPGCSHHKLQSAVRLKAASHRGPTRAKCFPPVNSLEVNGCGMQGGESFLTGILLLPGLNWRMVIVWILFDLLAETGWKWLLLHVRCWAVERELKTAWNFHRKGGCDEQTGDRVRGESVIWNHLGEALQRHRHRSLLLIRKESWLLTCLFV